MTVPDTDTLPKVSVFPPPVLRWRVVPAPDQLQAQALAATLKLPLALAALLLQRGHGTEEAARRFLRPSLSELSDPTLIAGMGEAVEAIAGTVRAGGRIFVHGDYDVDGQCASALLTRALRVAGADVLPFLPHRLRDGYDFGPAGLEAARAAGVSLIITCDCGITAVDTVVAANAAGIGVVITDHHLPGTELPPALAVVDPQRNDDSSGANALCGTGIAFKLVQALVPALGLPPNLPFHLLDLVALATVADVVPLQGENRILVKHGLKLLHQSPWPGLRALLDATGLAGKEVRAHHLGFILGPRLNAAGRVGDATDGLRLLLSDDAGEAAELARRLVSLNVERQALDQRILDEALEQVERTGNPERDAGFVLVGDGWHPGVVGIVASRVVERYGRPTFLIAFDGEIGKGSGRSTSRFNLHDALLTCGDLLERYGGHHMAAGLTIRRGRLDAFRERFGDAARQALGPDDLGPEQRVDLEVGLHEVTRDLERLCRYLEPCGQGNPSPVFGVRGVRFTNRSVVGTGHLKGALDDGRTRLWAIGFQWADRVPWLGDGLVDAAFRIECDEYNGLTSLQAKLCALTPHVPG
ncbi:MAG TPA: single-stranded-DNA-specific exonuclease RecJ [Gemmatimonadales bacterium]|nr:single-stranded-DNA-specific exonuclease RecJ [Gemmatimonadales bacterium]